MVLRGGDNTAPGGERGFEVGDGVALLLHGSAEHPAGEVGCAAQFFGVVDAEIAPGGQIGSGAFELLGATLDLRLGAGEPFERALTNVYRAFNWLLQGKIDEALVEARKAGIFLDELNRTLEGKAKYKDDAFAQYLSALLYADAGKLDDARISMEKAMAAYGWYQSSYGSPTPHFEFPKEDQKAPHGELVFVHFNGVAPIKISKTFQVAWGNALAIAKENDTEAQGAQFSNGLRAGITGNSITVSYPEYQAQPFKTKSSEVQIDGGQAVSSCALGRNLCQTRSEWADHSFQRPLS